MGGVPKTRTGELRSNQVDDLTRWTALFLVVPESFAREIWPHVELESALRQLSRERVVLRTRVGTPRACFAVSDRERARLGAEALEQWDAATVASWRARAVPHWQAAQEHGSLIVHLLFSGHMDDAALLLLARWQDIYLPAGHSVFLDAVEAITVQHSGPDRLEFLAIHRLLLEMLWPPSSDAAVDLQLLAVTPDQAAELATGPRLLITSAIILALTGTGALKAAIHLGESYLHHPTADGGNLPRERVPFLFIALAQTYAMAGLWAKACLYAARAEELPHIPVFATFRACVLRSLAHALNGEYDESMLCSARARAISLEEGWELTGSHFELIVADMFVAYAGLDGAALEEVASRLSRSFPSNPAWATTALVAEAMAHLCRGEPRRGVAALRAVLNGSEHWGLLGVVRGFALCINADLLLADGAAGEALAFLEKARSPRGHMLCFDVQRASAYIILGQPAQALVCTDACIALGHEHCLRTLPPVLLRRAVAYEQLGLSEMADRSFHDAFLLLRRSRALTPFLNLPPAVMDLLWTRLRQQHAAYDADIREIMARSSALQARAVVGVSGGGLTARELQLAAMLSHSTDVRHLARELFLSPNTVKVHLRNLYNKLGVHSRATAIARIEELGLLSIKDP